jgi:hypothetical protein
MQDCASIPATVAKRRIWRMDQVHFMSPLTQSSDKSKELFLPSSPDALSINKKKGKHCCAAQILKIDNDSAERVCVRGGPTRQFQEAAWPADRLPYQFSTRSSPVSREIDGEYPIILDALLMSATECRTSPLRGGP